MSFHPLLIIYYIHNLFNFLFQVLFHPVINAELFVALASVAWMSVVTIPKRGDMLAILASFGDKPFVQ
jgi:hypothetical protein